MKKILYLGGVMVQRLLFIMFLLSIPLISWGQSSVKEKLEEAWVMMDHGEYQGAEERFREAVEKGEETTEVYLGLGRSLKRQGAYQEAIQVFQKIDRREGDARVEQAIKACQASLKWKENPVCEVKPVPALNSPKRDFAPAYADTLYSSLIFTSIRRGKSQGEGIFYSSRANYGKWSKPELFDDALETPQHDGASIMLHQERTLYLTRCDKEYSCDLVRYEKEGTDWKKKAVMDILQPCAPDTVNVGHPSYFKSERKLFFASDLPGGQGGYDIWYITFDPETEKWTDPVNAGREVNSSGDEMFPHIRENGTLYFSSDGYMGMGGMDIFKAERKNPDVWKKGENMGYPINSEGDDFGIIFEGNGMKGFFSTNRDRKGTKGKDDIFEFFLET